MLMLVIGFSWVFLVVLPSYIDVYKRQEPFLLSSISEKTSNPIFRMVLHREKVIKIRILLYGLLVSYGDHQGGFRLYHRTMKIHKATKNIFKHP